MANLSLASLYVGQLYRCSLCGLDKPITDFYKDNSRAGGFRKRCKPCWNARYMPGFRTIKTEFQGLTGHWSKWDSGIRGEIVYTQIGLIGTEEEWACQSCGMTQPKDLTPYLYRHPDAEVQSERLRVCAVCFNNNCYELRRRRGEV